MRREQNLRKPLMNEEAMNVSCRNLGQRVQPRLGQGEGQGGCWIGRLGSKRASCTTAHSTPADLRAVPANVDDDALHLLVGVKEVDLVPDLKGGLQQGGGSHNLLVCGAEPCLQAVPQIPPSQRSLSL